MAVLPPTLKSLAKAAILSKRLHFPKSEGKRIIIMGNGPSLADTINEHAQTLHNTPLMAVNFAANTPQFQQLKPRYYLLADPHFFKGSNDENVGRLFDNLRNATWRMTLFVPFPALKKVRQLVGETIETVGYNLLAAEGNKRICNRLFNSGRAMPRPRNVLVPSIMTALKMGYHEIYVVGADHTWIQTLQVDNNNHIVSIQPHFYKEDDKEIERVRRTYVDIPLHQVLDSLGIALRSYHALNRYAHSIGAHIYNATPVSLIDAFERRPLP